MEEVSAPIKGLEVNSKIVSFYLVKEVLLKKGANGPYLDITLSDNTGNINAKLWQCDPEAANLYAKGSLVKVKASVTEYRGKLQMNIGQIRLATNEDAVKIENFVEAAPIDAQTMYDTVSRYAGEIEDQDIRKLVEYFLEKNKEKLLYYPAAKSFHHAIRSGLLFHMVRMLELSGAVATVYPNLNRDLLYAGVILHDMEKTSELISDTLALAEYSVEGEMLGHLVMGVKKIDLACRELKIPEEKSLILQHMVLSHHQKTEYGSPKPPMIPEAEMLHYIDMMDARQYSFEKALRDTTPGEMTERIYELDNRRIYHYRK